VEPFKKALEWFIQWLVNLVEAVVNAILTPLLNLIKNALAGIVSPVIAAMQQLYREFRASGHPSQQAMKFFGEALFGNAFYGIFIVVLVVEVVFLVITVLTLPFSFIMQTILGIVMGLILMAIVGVVLSAVLHLSLAGADLSFSSAFRLATSVASGAGSPEGPRSVPVGIGTRGQIVAAPRSLTSDLLTFLASIADAIGTTKAAQLLDAAKKPPRIAKIALGLSVAMAALTIVIEFYWKATLPSGVEKTLSAALDMTMLSIGIMALLASVLTEPNTPDDETTQKIANVASGIAVALSFAALVVDVTSE